MTKPSRSEQNEELRDPDQMDKIASPKARLIGILVLALIVAAGITAALVLPRVLERPVNLSCLDGRLDGFFDKQAATEDEVQFQNRVADYATRLAGFSCDEGHRLSDFTDPVEGYWMGDEGYFAFSRDKFYWSVSLEGDATERYFAGYYTWLPGCEFEEVLEMDRSDRPCYTVFLRYEETMSSDVLSDDLFYGGLIIAQDSSGQPAKYLSMFNMRTGGSFYVDRLEQ